MQRANVALDIARMVIWLIASFFIYVALAIAIYVPLASLDAPSNADSWTRAFYARAAAAVLLHQVAALGTWLLLGRWIGAPRTAVAILSVVGIALLALMTLSMVIFFRP